MKAAWAAGIRIGLLVLMTSCAWGQDAEGQNPPPAPSGQSQSGDKKDENPAAEAVHATAEATKKLGEETLGKVRDWESGWLTGPYVGRERRLVALTNEQRQQIYLQQTLTTPSAYFKRMFEAGFDQLRDSPSQWGEGWGAFGKRFASREGQFLTANSLAALGNWKLKYEPRYDECRCRGFGPRTRHALVRSFLTYNETERERRPQWALFGGAFAAGMIASTWKPGRQNVWTAGTQGMVEQVGYGAALNFFTEFAGEINRKLGGRRR